MQICALRFTDKVRARLLQHGATLLTFDQLALKAPKGENTLLMQGGQA